LPEDHLKAFPEAAGMVGWGGSLSEDFLALAGFRAGALVAGYRLEAQVGAGGMAVVFRARDERLNRPVALKILSPALAADHEFRRRFIAESRAAAAVDDPHIIPVYEAGEAGGMLFIAMRFVKGGDLRLVLDREGALPPARAATFISPVASALDAAHAAGLVHRDVKPANILVDARAGRPDHVYLSDFGVSKGASSSVGLTGAGQFLGTPGYSAPEQIQGWAVDGRTDQYALACVAYQLLAGGAPFERDQGMAVLLAHLSQPAPLLTSRRPGLPRAADEVLARGLAKTPEKRYASCRDFADALRDALGLEPYHTRAPIVPSGSPGTAPARQPVVQADPQAEATIDSPVPGSPGRTGNVPAAASAVVSSARSADARDSGAMVPTPAPMREGSRLARPARPNRLIERLKQPATGMESAARAADAPPASPEHARRSGPGDHRTQRAWIMGHRLMIASLGAVLAVILLGGYVAWRWSQDQYYVGADSKGRQVLIYRGVNQHIAGVSLSQPYQLTGIELTQVPPSYQQTVRATDAASSLSGARAIVANIRSAVTACQQGYIALQQWVVRDNAYQAALTLARKQHKPPEGIQGPGPKPPELSMCQPSTAFGIAPSALVPAPAAS
jgi:serine/threonine protein kinase